MAALDVVADRVTFDDALWSMVFPLGMYAAASMVLGSTTGLPFQVTTGRVATVVATLVWAAVLTLAGRDDLRHLARVRRGPGCSAQQAVEGSSAGGCAEAAG